MLNFGESRHVPAGLHTVSEFVSRSERASVLWVLAGDVLDGVTDHGFFLNACADILQHAAHVRHFAVFSDIMPPRLHLMRSFKERGFGVYFGGPHRECLVEVLKPDGSIFVGMPGPEFTVLDKS